MFGLDYNLYDNIYANGDLNKSRIAKDQNPLNANSNMFTKKRVDIGFRLGLRLGYMGTPIENVYPSKVQKITSTCDNSKESHWLTDHEYIIEFWNLTDLLAKNF